jgi:transposase-like protein
MKASKFTDAQKAFVIKQGEEGTPVAEVCRKAGISQPTDLNWKKKYAGRCRRRSGGCVSWRKRTAASSGSSLT